MALMLGGLALYARHAVLDRDAFAARATGALHQDEVVDEVVARIATREIEDNPALAARRPILEAAVGDVVADPRFAAEFHTGALVLHDALFGDGGVAVPVDGARAPIRVRVTALALPGAGRELRAAVAARSPATASEVPREDPVLFSLGGGKLETALVDAAPHAQRLSALAPLAFAAGILLLGLAAWRAPTRRLGFRRGALGIALASGAIVAASSIARAVVLSTFDTAFEGTVTSIQGDTVTLQTTEVFTGEVGETVQVTSPPDQIGALIQAVDFKQGKTYLISATDGMVAVCGNSGPATGELRSLYDQAFVR